MFDLKYINENISCVNADIKSIYKRIASATEFQFSINHKEYIVRKTKRIIKKEYFALIELTCNVYYDFKNNKFSVLDIYDYKSFETNDIFQCFEILERIKNES